MPCENSEYDGSDYGSSQADNLEQRQHQQRERISIKGHLNNKGSSAALMTSTPDKGNPACSISHTSSPSDLKSLIKEADCPSHALKDNIVEDCRNSLTNDSNSPLTLTTHANDQRLILSGNHNYYHTRQEQDFSKKLSHSLRDRSPISMNDLSADLPKAAVSPGVKKKDFSSSLIFQSNLIVSDMHHQDVKHALTENNEGYPAVTDMKRDFHFNPHDKVSSQAAPSSMLYNLLHCTASGDHYKSLDSRFDHIRSPSSAFYSHFNGSTSSSITLPCTSDVMMKSSPELSSYFNSNGSPQVMEQNRALTPLGDASSPFVISQCKYNTTRDSASPYQTNSIRVKSEAEESLPSLPQPNSSSSVLSASNDELWVDDRESTATISTPRMSRLGIKQEIESSSSLLSPGGFSPRDLSPSSPYMSNSLSPWSERSSDFSHVNDTVGTPIKNKAKCASDSSLYLPSVVQPSLSPTLSSSNPAPNESVVVDCRWKRCTQSFTSQKALAQHVNDCHVRIERPDIDFQCHWQGCPRQGKGFNARYKMLIHIRTHTNEKPHKCAVCRKCFSRLENLKIHMRSHTGEKPYACTFPGCTKAYSNSSDRFKHARTHQEEKPYKCKMAGCHKQYTDPSSLRKHVRTHGHATKFNQTPLRRAMSIGDAMQVNNKDLSQENCSNSALIQHRLRLDVEEDFNKGLKMDNDRQLRQGLDAGQNDMMDIQRNIELYSSLEVKSGIQKFGQVEDCIREDYQSSVSQQNKPESAKIGINTPQRIRPHSRQLFLSIPSIIIEEIRDSFKPEQERDEHFLTLKRNAELNEVCHSRIKRKIENLEKEEEGNNLSSREENGEDLRNGKESSKEGVVSKMKLNVEGNIEPSPNNNASSPSTLSSSSSSSTSTSSHPKHWKKRKIEDEERLSLLKMQKEEVEDIERRANKQRAIEELDINGEKLSSTSPSKCQSPNPLDEGIKIAHHNLSHLLPSELNNLSTQFLQSLTSHSSTSFLRSLPSHSNTSPISVSPTSLLVESLASPTMVSHLASSTFIPSDSSQYPPSSSLYPHSPLCCSPLPLCSYNLSLPNRHCPHPPFLSPSILCKYPELHSANSSSFPSSEFKHSLSSDDTASTDAAMFFPKAEKNCRNLCFPSLSTLMDFSARLDSMPRHLYHQHHLSHHHLPSMVLSSHHHQVVDPTTNMICSTGCPSVSRTL